jgi:CHAT domain-containing protein
LEGTLAQAAAQLFPGDIADALAVEGGRLLLLSARDTGTAPLAALPIPGGERLADRWATLVLPDVRALLDPRRVYDMREVDLKNALVVGDPDLQGDPEYIWQQLPGARKEAAEVVKIMRIDEPRLLIDGKATKAEVAARLAGKRTDFIYLATHGIANSTNPMDGSFLALANGHLFGRDLRHSRFDIWSAFHPLVVLSACQTGLGRTFEGGAYGIARAWVQAGAAQVIASLWNVSDEATQQLMARFADKLDIGATPEEAMRSSQLHAASLYPDDPGAWASFAVMGMPAIRKVN